MVKPTELRYKVRGEHFHFEQVWQLDGLVKARMLNGKLCIVKRPTNRPGETPGRLKVKVLSQPDPVHVKPKNLKAVDVEAYEALPDDEKEHLLGGMRDLSAYEYYQEIYPKALIRLIEAVIEELDHVVRPG